ncbi:hypothetical protein CEUSTIGMA_g1300.t1 [Chlamydomonas eustigma]|uniref:Thioredoxin domain-containing protein n=1 Tax=Chlamydomonas eustigma TaxID=1157962 RepID=A0A250WTJ0_9CHLO|nr:hypothetical protein CEUSTIGMA_g1300.t1 [Chlamydomonas eustigma]|eukprot:GAX73850.1 hypothetical protein CEUSTIGMA_g1300.t1 [Chlamydomonas eustigma]
MTTDAYGKMDAKKFGSAMSTIAHSQAVMAAVRDYKKEMEETQSLAGQEDQTRRYDIKDMIDDPELQNLHAERIAKLQQEHERRVQMQHQGHGTVTEITEGEFLEVVTKSQHVICHFFHRDFERCKIMDKHLAILAKRHFKTRFVKISAPDTPFFTVKLNIKMLPCVTGFIQGVSVHRIVGFDGLGGIDDFETSALENQFLECGVLEPLPVEDPAVADDRIDGPRGNARKGFANIQRTESDEDSDFD